MTPESTATALEALLEDLANLGDNAGMTSIAREIRNERLPALREGRMSMVVLGEFNHGKSTAINALLGGDVLPTGITPTTAVITHIVGGHGPTRVVRDSGSEEIPVEALGRYLTEDAPADLQYVEVRSQSDFLTGGVYVVDTPGVNDISQQKVEITYGYVPRADVIVYVLDATQALKRSEITFIRNRLMRGSHERMYFLLGKIDALTSEELKEVLEHVRGKLDELVGPVPLFPVSQRRALKGDDPGFSLFKDAIHDAMRAQRAQIVFEGAMRTGRRLSWLLEQNLAIEEGALQLETAELERRVQTVRGKLSDSRLLISENLELIDRRIGEIKATAEDNVRSFAASFAAALPQEVEKASADDIKRYLPDFVHDTFKDWLEKEGQKLGAKLETLAEDVISITTRNMSETMNDVQDELGVRAKSLDLDINTFGYDVGVAALGAVGFGMMLTRILAGGVLIVAAPVLAFALKGRVDNLLRTKASEQGLKAIQLAADKIEEEFNHVIDDFGDRLKRFIEHAGDRLYSQVVEALDRVVSERRAHSGDNTHSTEKLVESRATLALISARIEALGRGEDPDTVTLPGPESTTPATSAKDAGDEAPAP